MCGSLSELVLRSKWVAQHALRGLLGGEAGEFPPGARGAEARRAFFEALFAKPAGLALLLWNSELVKGFLDDMRLNSALLASRQADEDEALLARAYACFAHTLDGVHALRVHASNGVGFRVELTGCDIFWLLPDLSPDDDDDEEKGDGV